MMTSLVNFSAPNYEAEVFNVDWGTALGSGVTVALITSLFSKMSADKNVRIENITKERKAWRDRMRELVLQANDAFHKRESRKISMVEAELIVRLNPNDANDWQIVESIRELRKGWDNKLLVEFNDRMALLLKHDWERVKIEASRTISPQKIRITLIVLTSALALIARLAKITLVHVRVANIALVVNVVLVANVVLVIDAVLVVIACVVSHLLHDEYGKKDTKKWLRPFIAWFQSEPQRHPYPCVSLDKEFDLAMVTIYQRAKKKCGKDAQPFLQMLDERGGLGTAKDLLAKGEISDEFAALRELGRLDLTVVALVLDAKYASLFADYERKVAEERLHNHGYKLARS
jgi:hypothetical protein